MNILEAVREWWGWAGISPIAIVAENQFGNLLLQDEEGKYWRLCPEETYCRVVAHDRNEFELLFKNAEFLDGWCMTTYVWMAQQSVGILPSGKKYSLKVPISLGGLYKASNIESERLLDLLVVSGQIAKSINGSSGGKYSTKSQENVRT